MKTTPNSVTTFVDGTFAKYMLKRAEELHSLFLSEYAGLCKLADEYLTKKESGIKKNSPEMKELWNEIKMKEGNIMEIKRVMKNMQDDVQRLRKIYDKLEEMGEKYNIE